MHFQEGQSSSEQHATISFEQEHVPDPQDWNPQNKPQVNQFMIGSRISMRINDDANPKAT